jgi:hypothetical protein
MSAPTMATVAAMAGPFPSIPAASLVEDGPKVSA